MAFPAAAIRHVPSFLEYLQGGCQLNLIVGIDFTGACAGCAGCGL